MAMPVGLPRESATVMHSSAARSYSSLPAPRPVTARPMGMLDSIPARLQRLVPSPGIREPPELPGKPPTNLHDAQAAATRRHELEGEREAVEPCGELGQHGQLGVIELAPL